MADFITHQIDITTLKCTKNNLWLTISFDDISLPISITRNILVLEPFADGLICQDCMIFKNSLINDHNIYEIPSVLLLHLMVDTGITIKTVVKEGVTSIYKTGDDYHVCYKIIENSGSFMFKHKYETTFDDYDIGFHDSVTYLYQLPDMFISDD